MNIYMCICVYVCMCVGVYMFAHIHAYMHVCMYIYMYQHTLTRFLIAALPNLAMIVGYLIDSWLNLYIFYLVKIE